VLLLRESDPARLDLLRLLLEQEVDVMRLRRALLLAAGAILLPAVASGQT
jgi:hypothetical protein